MNTRGRAAGAFVLVAMIMASSACSTASSGASSSPGQRPPVTQPPPSNGTASAPPTPARVVVSTRDLGPGWEERGIPGGNKVANQVTLDLCGGGYRSESDRRARLQIVLRHGPAVVSNEVVEYQPGGAHLAYQELRHRLTNCPSTPVAEPEAGSPAVRWTLQALRTQKGWAAESVAVRGTGSAQGKTHTSIAIYQFDGNWMSAVYTGNASAASIRAAKRVAVIESRKLAAAAQDRGPAT